MTIDKIILGGIYDVDYIFRTLKRSHEGVNGVEYINRVPVTAYDDDNGRRIWFVEVSGQYRAVQVGLRINYNNEYILIKKNGISNRQGGS